MPEIVRVIGPPGAGKTHFMLQQIEEACNHYAIPDICVASFTTAAVREARDRIVKTLNVQYEKIKNVRTIHSQCFHLINAKSEDMMELGKNIREFNENYPAYSISGGGKSDTDDQREFTGNDKIFNDMQLLRSKMIPVDDWPSECRQFGDAWFEYMENEGKFDFTSLIEECLRRELFPEIKVLFVDEAQDLNKLEMTLMECWGKQCDKVMYLADANQAIFRFSGADPDIFINMKADKVIKLEQSYRLSPAVLNKSVEIISQAHIKEMVDFQPIDSYGYGQVISVREPDLSLDGTHMILCRCNFQLTKYIKMLREKNIPYGNQYRIEDKTWNPFETDAAKSLRIYFKMRKMEDLDIYELKQLVKNCIAKTTMRRGTKKFLETLPLTTKHKYDLFAIINMGFLPSFIDKHGSLRDYFRIKSDAADLLFHTANTNSDQFFETPRVCVGTIHSTKGGEARHVWVDTGITTKVKKSIQESIDAWDDEVRITYTACTRAQETLGFIRGPGYQNPFLG